MTFYWQQVYIFSFWHEILPSGHVLFSDKLLCFFILIHYHLLVILLIADICLRYALPLQTWSLYTE